MKHKSSQVREALDEVRSVYADLGSRPIQRNCVRLTNCCHFKLTGRTPHLTKGEALEAARALRATGRNKLPEVSDGACPMLDPRTRHCLIYESRPFGCRTHFCSAAGGPYSRRDVIDLIRRLEAVDVKLGGDGPKVFLTAVNDAVAEFR